MALIFAVKVRLQTFACIFLCKNYGGNYARVLRLTAEKGRLILRFAAVLPKYR